MIDTLKTPLKGLVILTVISIVCTLAVMVLDHYGLTYLLIGGLGLLCILLMAYVLGGIYELYK